MFFAGLTGNFLIIAGPKPPGVLIIVSTDECGGGTGVAGAGFVDVELLALAVAATDVDEGVPLSVEVGFWTGASF